MFREIEVLSGDIIRIKQIPIWKTKKSFFDIKLKGVKTIEVAKIVINAYLWQIENVINWLESSRNEIGQFLINTGMKEKAEEWVSQAEHIEKSNIYRIGAATVSLPIDDQVFINNLAICDVSVDLNSHSNIQGFDSLFLEIIFDPDYFEYHPVHVEVKNKQFINKGL